MRRPNFNFLTSFKFDNKGPITVTSSCVSPNYRSKLERTVNLPFRMMLTPNLIASDRRMMADLL
jgi:hypothetical protein